MSRFLSSVVLLAVASVVGLGSAFAADAKKGEKKERKRPSAEAIFKKLDADKDGKLTAEELVKSPRISDDAKAKEVVGRMDTNKDGSVCVKEFAAALQKRHAAHSKEGGHKKHDHKKGDHKKGDHKKGDHKKGEKKECPSKKK